MYIGVCVHVSIHVILRAYKTVYVFSHVQTMKLEDNSWVPRE